MYNAALYRSARLANPDVRCITIPVNFEAVDRVLGDRAYGRRAARARHNGVFAAAELICTHLEGADASRSIHSARSAGATVHVHS